MRILNAADGVAGGTGKSPMVRWIAECDLARNVLPLITLRGYRSHQSQSDEAMEHQSALPDAKIALGANRFATISAAVGQDPTVEIVVLHDGFSTSNAGAKSRFVFDRRDQLAT